MPINFQIHSNICDYETIIEETDDFLNELAKIEPSFFVIDENVWNIYSHTLLRNLQKKNILVIPIHEELKNLESVKIIYDQLLELTAKRNLTLISIGGGILQDISGFAASTIYRGIKWIFVPTTLLAQSDSCIGSKTSLNYQGFKNLIGTFYPPQRIHIYTPFLQTLQNTDFHSGLGEVIKLHLMGGEILYTKLAELFPSLVKRETEPLQTAIIQSLEVKINYLAGDEFDNGRRNFLNFGHDFGHALENTSQFEIPHGQAVVVGMLAANVISRQRGLLNSKLEQQIAKNLLLPGLAIKPVANWLEPEAITSALKRDKKRIGDSLAIIMMKNDFEFTRVNNLTPHEVEVALDELKKMLSI